MCWSDPEIAHDVTKNWREFLPGSVKKGQFSLHLFSGGLAHRKILKMNCDQILSIREAKSKNFWEELNGKLNQLTKQTGYTIVRENGQRIYSAPMDAAQKPPERGCEIFIGKIPKDMYEDELIPVFSKPGKIYKFRLMIEFSGLNRGYGFVTYYTMDVVRKALSTIHEYEVRPGKHLGVYLSIDNCRLFVGGIPTDKTRAEVHDALGCLVEGIKDVIMYQAYLNRQHNRGFVFLEFETHRLAAMARRKLAPGSLFLWGNSILVDWADPLPVVDPEIMSQVTKLYLRNLDSGLTKDDLWTFISRFTPRENVIKVHKMYDYAFIHFVKRDVAENVFELIQGEKIFNVPIEVEWARPTMYSKSRDATLGPTHYCMSLPSRIRKLIYRRKTKEFARNAKTVKEDKSSSSDQSEHENYKKVLQDGSLHDYFPIPESEPETIENITSALKSGLDLKEPMSRNRNVERKVYPMLHEEKFRNPSVEFFPSEPRNCSTPIYSPIVGFGKPRIINNLFGHQQPQMINHPQFLPQLTPFGLGFYTK